MYTSVALSCLVVAFKLATLLYSCFHFYFWMTQNSCGLFISFSQFLLNVGRRCRNIAPSYLGCFRLAGLSTVPACANERCLNVLQGSRQPWLPAVMEWSWTPTSTRIGRGEYRHGSTSQPGRSAGKCCYTATYRASSISPVSYLVLSWFIINLTVRPMYVLDCHFLKT